MKYRDAGVDLDRGQEAVRRIRRLLEAAGFGDPANIGRFGGILPLDALRQLEAPLLVASIDGVGTKTLVAALADRWDVVGYDVIAHGINDILVQGARPLAALDYIGTGRLNPDRIEAIVRGMLACCKETGTALIGGETAEMPDVYQPSDADIVAVVLGVVDRSRLLGPERVRPGDRLWGLASSGLHTNGFSLVRRLFFDILNWSLDRPLEELGMTLGEALLQPHRCYYPIIGPLVAADHVHAMAHITGGGLIENVARALPPHLDAVIERRAWSVPPLFRLIQDRGQVPELEMYRTFNMGVGLVLILGPEDEAVVARHLQAQRFPAWPIGHVQEGAGRVHFEPPLEASS